MSGLPNDRDCIHGHLRRKCDECHLLEIAKGCVGWDATPEQAMLAMRSSLDRYKRQHEFDTQAKEELRQTIAKLLAAANPS